MNESATECQSNGKKRLRVRLGNFMKCYLFIRLNIKTCSFIQLKCLDTVDLRCNYAGDEEYIDMLVYNTRIMGLLYIPSSKNFKQVHSKNAQNVQFDKLQL